MKYGNCQSHNMFSNDASDKVDTFYALNVISMKTKIIFCVESDNA